MAVEQFETFTEGSTRVTNVFADGEMIRLVALPGLTAGQVTRGNPRRRSWLLFCLLVVLPTLMAGLYFGFLAPDRFVSEARFSIVRSNSAGHLPGGMFSVESSPKAIEADDAYAVRDFIGSRDAMRLLLDKADLRSALTPARSDPFWRFPGGLNGESNERLYRYLRSLISVDYDATTAMTTLQVRAFTPQDAQRIALVLLDGCEDLVNRLNDRARDDARRVAEEDVTRARAEATAAEEALTQFRNKWSLVDPTAYSQTILATITALSLEEVEATALLDVTTHSSPKSPQIAPLQARIRALHDQIEHERDRLAGSHDSLAPMVAEYERLLLLRDFAAKSFVTALTELEAARQDGERQQAYLTRVVTPMVADEPYSPYRLGMPLLVFVLGMLVFGAVRPATRT